MRDMQYYQDQEVDVIVVGAGHAGCEAALATSRLGLKTIIYSISLESVADMPCNPNIGGTGKGHLVREIDALGGEMAINIDKNTLQSRMLNTSKGSAIHSLRVQADKQGYHNSMKQILERQENLKLVESEVIEICVEEIEQDGTKQKQVIGVKTLQGAMVKAKAVIIATGTFLKSKILMGELEYSSGPHGTKPSEFLSSSLKKLGFELRRFKTGTPARINKRSIDFSTMIEQKGDYKISPFSFINQGKQIVENQYSCYLTYTTKETSKIINENLYRSPMYSGEKHGVGPRYCPSIEDKIVRFSDRDRHQVFIEPEGISTDECYVQGVSSTLPEEVQKKLYKTIEGLENVEFMRSAYGIEYDVIDSRILNSTLETRLVKGLYFAGQINGSSGYEEAASQGLMAGINCALKLQNKPPFILDRSEAYIGVLIDDLVTKGTNEPYRMMTSRCEYRLSLRQDNADLRLTEKSHKIGLATRERLELVYTKKKLIDEEIERLKSTSISPSTEVNDILRKLGTSELKSGITLFELLKRPEVSYETLNKISSTEKDLPPEVISEVETQIKYAGYIEKQHQQIKRFKDLEQKKLNIDDYSIIKGLKKEAVQKLNDVKPENIGQASRISGVSPADIQVILIHLEVESRKNISYEKE